MKKTSLTSVLMITMLFIFSTVSYAQGHSYRWYGCMTYLNCAEQKIKDNQLQVYIHEEERVEISANVVVIDDRNKSVKLKLEDDK